MLSLSYYSPPVPSGQPGWGTGDRIPHTPCVAKLRNLYFLFHILTSDYHMHTEILHLMPY